jgi:hypothetical protein
MYCTVYKDSLLSLSTKPRPPGPQAPRPQAPGPQAPGPQAPCPRTPGPQAPRPSGPQAKDRLKTGLFLLLLSTPTPNLKLGTYWAHVCNSLLLGDVDWLHHPKFSFGLRFQITSRRSATPPDGSWLLGNYYEHIYLCILGNIILQLKKWPVIMCMCYVIYYL